MVVERPQFESVFWYVYVWKPLDIFKKHLAKGLTISSRDCQQKLKNLIFLTGSSSTFVATKTGISGQNMYRVTNCTLLLHAGDPWASCSFICRSLSMKCWSTKNVELLKSAFVCGFVVSVICQWAVMCLCCLDTTWRMCTRTQVMMFP